MSQRLQPVVIYRIFRSTRWFKFGPRRFFYQLYPQNVHKSKQDQEPKIRELTFDESLMWLLMNRAPHGTYVPNKQELKRLSEQRLRLLVRKHKSH